MAVNAKLDGVTVEVGSRLLPFYVVLDVSYSMGGAKLDALNTILPAVVDAITENPILADKVRLCLIDFSDDARVRMPLCDVLAQEDLPTLTVRGATSWAAAFRLLRSEIEANVHQLKADGYQVHRPAVFFLTDGLPTDTGHEWRAAFADLVGQKAYPNIIPFGVSDADPRELQAVIFPNGGPKQMRMYLMDEGADAGKAISALAEVLVTSVLASGHSMSMGSSGIVLPDGDSLSPEIKAYSADDDFV